jgi:hypothetical protein
MEKKMILFLAQALWNATSKRLRKDVQNFFSSIDWLNDSSDALSDEVKWAFFYYPDLYVHIDKFILKRLEKSSVSSEHIHEFIKKILKNKKNTSNVNPFPLIHCEKSVLYDCIGNMNSADERIHALLNHLVIQTILSQKKNPNAELLALRIKAILPILQYYRAVEICEKALLLVHPLKGITKVLPGLQGLLSDQGEDALAFIDYCAESHPKQHDKITDIVASQLCAYVDPSREIAFPKRLIKALQRGVPFEDDMPEKNEIGLR